MQVPDLPWIEKYRPHSLEEVIGQKLIVDRLKSFVQKGNFPNMIFAGSAGIGKTTCAIAMANDIYSGEFDGAFRELNASVTPDTPILIRRSGNMERTTMGEIAGMYFGDEVDKYAYPGDLEVLSINKKTLKVEFLPVRNISRHKVSKIRRIRFESGSVKTTLNHSVIVVDKEGSLSPLRAENLKIGDSLITFKTVVEGTNKTLLDVAKFAPNPFVKWKNRVMFKNPKIRTTLRNINVDNEIAWFFGSFMAEGVTGFGHRRGGVSVLTYAYPKEVPFAKRSMRVVENLGFTAGVHTIVSGSSGRESGIQMAASSTQLAKFFHQSFYEDGASSKTARHKKVPGFIFELPIEMRHEFLKGYAGDANGEWGDFLRYTSISKNLLIDTTWMARISGLESAIFDRNNECRIIWKKATSFYAHSDLIAAGPFIAFLREIKAGFNWRYELRHSLYCKKSKRVEKQLITSVLNRIDDSVLTEEKRAQLTKLRSLAESDISSLEIKGIQDMDYEGYVYDISVPDSEMFWGGTVPLLLHNSDTRGIDVIRGTVKEFAKTRSMAKVPIKIIFLDEADALTADAQHALRRTMEKYSKETRFILSANYASKIIEPIQSRCVVFRFKPLTEQDMRDYIQRIVKGEGLTIEDNAVEALIYVGDGDLRKLTNILQSSALQNTNITEASIYEVASKARPKEIVAMLKNAIAGDFDKARMELDNLMLKQGMSAEDILTQCYKEVQTLQIEERAKLKTVVALGEANFRIVEGANERIQLETMIAQLALITKA